MLCIGIMVIKMGGWAYGLVEMDGRLVLCEVYNVQVGKNFERGYYEIKWKDMTIKTKVMVLQDLKLQFESKMNNLTYSIKDTKKKKKDG
jgi:hypothetical protein